MTKGVQAAGGSGPASSERDQLRRVDAAPTLGDAAKRLVGLANEEAFARKREADDDRMRLEGRLGELARLSQANANAGRAKAAEFVVERLKASRERVEQLERQAHEQGIELREQQQLVTQYQQQHRAGLLGRRRRAGADGSGRGRRWRAGAAAARRPCGQLRGSRICQPEHAQEQARVIQTLYTELRGERKLVSQLEAVLPPARRRTTAAASAAGRGCRSRPAGPLPHPSDAASPPPPPAAAALPTWAPAARPFRRAPPPVGRRRARAAARWAAASTAGGAGGGARRDARGARR